MKTFELEIKIFAILTLDDRVIDAVDDEWRSHLYDLKTPEKIAEHIAFNLLQGRSLSDLDGWADQPDSNANLSIDDMSFETTSTK